ncbi:protein of unknown function [Agreia sp. COWG]|nr:protein of unknown function [Agreia sp. COWG]
MRRGGLLYSIECASSRILLSSILVCARVNPAYQLRELSLDVDELAQPKDPLHIPGS